MPTIEEKRVYADRTGRTEVYVASSTGVVVVDVSDDLVGEFSLARRCDPRDVAAADGDVAVATEEDLLVLAAGAFEPTGFGPAVAVDIDVEGNAIVAADGAGTIARRSTSDATERGDWTDVGTVDGDVTAIDWPFVATDAGLYQLGNGDPAYAGLTDVADVSTTGVPLAATDDGLYKLGNGWMREVEGVFHAVASTDSRAHAASDHALYERTDDDWTVVDHPVEQPVQDIAYTPTATVGVTESGTMLLTAGDGWRTRMLGVGGVVGLAVR